MFEFIKVLTFREFKILRHGFVFWQDPKVDEPDALYFSYHKNNQDTFLFLGLLIAFLMEWGIVHVLMLNLWPAYAWPFFWMGFLSVIYILGLWSSFKVNPIILTPNKFIIKWGLNLNKEISLEDILDVTSGQFKDDQESVWALKYMAIPNVKMTFKSPIITKPGIKGGLKYSEIAFFIDKPGDFMREFKKLGNRL